MTTLLQTLLLETLPKNTDPILRSFIETVLPAMEREFALVYAMGGEEDYHYQISRKKHEEKKAREIARSRANKPEQSLLVHVLNALLTAWNLSQYLPERLQLTDVEKRLLCLGMTLHDYNKYADFHGEQSPRPREVPAILNLCQKLGEKLNFQEFWPAWQQYLPDIAYLAQNTQSKINKNAVPANWEVSEETLTLDDRRLDLPLCYLLAFGDVAVHLNDPADIVNVKIGNKNRSSGDLLRENLIHLKITKKLVYHRLRDCRGLLTNGIHNILMHFTKQLGWEPILFFARGVVYLAPFDSEYPDLEDLQAFTWEQIKMALSNEMLKGEIGFKRDGKGLKVAPQTLEFFSPADLIRQLPAVIEARVGNGIDPATPKRLEKLTLQDSERELFKYADIRADRLAEFLILAQREFFEGKEEYTTWVLKALGLEERMTPEQTQVQSGGVNYGWYQAAAHCMAVNKTWDSDRALAELSNLGVRLATWAEENNLLPTYTSPTREDFFNYLAQYLEVSGWETQTAAFQDELAAYANAKTTNQPFCSLSSGEFAAEDQLDSVVLFKPQQYSNKNSLGGGRIKRGISKIWSLEMLLRQARWTGKVVKLEEQQPVFLSIFPAYVYSPQTAKAVRYLVEEMLNKKIKVWNVNSCWLDAKMHYSGLQNYPWLAGRQAEEGRLEQQGDKYSKEDLPLMAIVVTTTRGKTVTESWIEPAFLALALPMLLGVKIVASSSPEPLYSSDREFFESVKLDGAANFWNLLGLPTSVRLQDLEKTLNRLLVACSVHLDSRSAKPDARWQAFNGTVRELVTDVLNIFTLANEGLRQEKRDPTAEEVQRFWKFAELWAKGDVTMEKSLTFTKKLVSQYRQFYRVNINESTHAILLPFSKALEVILSSPPQIDPEELIWQGSGELRNALDRREKYNRPFLMNKSIDEPIRQAQEDEAILAFMTDFVNELFLGAYKGDRALLQANRNRLKAGAEFAYRWLDLQDKASESKSKGENK